MTEQWCPFTRRQLWINHKTRRQTASGAESTALSARRREQQWGKIGWRRGRKDGWYAGRRPARPGGPCGNSSSISSRWSSNQWTFGRTVVNTRWLAGCGRVDCCCCCCWYMTETTLTQTAAEAAPAVVCSGHYHTLIIYHIMQSFIRLNPLTGTLTPQSHGPLFHTAIRWLAHWTLMGGLLHLVQRWGDWRRRSPPRPLLAVPNVTVHPSTATVPTSYYSMWYYNYLWLLKG